MGREKGKGGRGKGEGRGGCVYCSGGIGAPDRIQLGALVGLTGEVVLGLPTLGVVGFGVPCWCGVGGPRPGASALLAMVRTLGI